MHTSVRVIAAAGRDSEMRYGERDRQKDRERTKAENKATFTQ